MKMPTRSEFAEAERLLIDAGFTFVMTLMVDDAKKEGVMEFGKFFVRHNPVTTDKFWLNYKTIGTLFGDGQVFQQQNKDRSSY